MSTNSRSVTHSAFTKFWWNPCVMKFRFFTVTCLTVTVGLLTYWAYDGSSNIPPFDTRDIKHFWDTNPIASVYVPNTFHGKNCAVGYAALPMAYNALAAVSKGACGCAKNDLGFQSTSTSCYAASEASDVCMSLSPLTAVASTTWQESTICVKRGGQAATTFDPTTFETHERPIPDDNGECPKSYKKCGAGLDQSEGAICFPADSECPITNMIVLPPHVPAPADQGWTSAGTFQANNHTLYVRREHVGELPVVDVVALLTEITSTGENLRGRCYNGTAQVFQGTLNADPYALWSYTAVLPPVCELADPRYALVDHTSIEHHFLSNLKSAEPTCYGQPLYAISDPRYVREEDPDYLHSGVPCGTAPLYSACARDPFQHTDCAAGDSICDGVVHQNICGEYARAVRSAFASSGEAGLSMGLYIAREVPWAEDCDMSRLQLFIERDLRTDFKHTLLPFCVVWILYHFIWSAHMHYERRFQRNAIVFLMLMVPLAIAVLVTRRMTINHDVLAQGGCTDAFTAHTLMAQLRPAIQRYHWMRTALCLVGVLFGINCVSHSATTDGSEPGSRERSVALYQQAVANNTRRVARTTGTTGTTVTTGTTTPATAPTPVAAPKPVASGPPTQVELVTIPATSTWHAMATAPAQATPVSVGANSAMYSAVPQELV